MPLEYALQRKGIEVTPWSEPPERKTKVTADVGLDKLPAQAVRHARAKGFSLNIMVAGESGLGKSTFLNTLFGSNLLPQTDIPLEDRKTKTVRANTFNLSENGVDLKVTTIDTPGFGVQLDRQTGVQPVVDYVNQQLLTYVGLEEREGFRSLPSDSRVHLCLYFIAPSGHSLTELDVVAMRALSEKVNLIPVIGKADTLTREELNDFRARLNKQIKAANIKVYPFDVCFNEDGRSATYEKLTPFAVVGSNTTEKLSDGRLVRARKYRWGLVEVENPEHSDFVFLRELIIRTNLYDLIEVTHRVHYERFRSTRLEQQGRADTLLQSDKNFAERLQQDRAAFMADFQKRAESLQETLKAQEAQKEAEFAKLEKQQLERREKILSDYEAERKKIAAALADVDSQLNQMATERESAQAESSQSKKKGILGASSLLRPKGK